MIRQTSIEAYQENQLSLALMQRKVYAVIRELGSINNNMISNYLNLPINCITPRTNELLKKGFVEIDKIDKCPFTEKRTIYWKLTKMKGGLNIK